MRYQEFKEGLFVERTDGAGRTTIGCVFEVAPWGISVFWKGQHGPTDYDVLDDNTTSWKYFNEMRICKNQPLGITMDIIIK